jgi:4-amino-4-deoxychorismate lyase
LIYTPQNTFEVTYHPYSKRNIKTLKIIEVDTLEYSQKYENRDTLNYYFEQREDADDILFVKNALVTDTTIANIAFYQDGVWFTPASPLLEGTTRERYLESGVLIPKDIKVEELHNYSQIALLNAMIDFDIIADIRFK